MRSNYRPEIDGIRAFAVIAVIINHFNKNVLPGGYLGVDIFFVISGYVITSSLNGRNSLDFKDFITGFYERRVKRLIPALVVFVLVMSLLISLFNPLPEESLKTGLTALFGLSNMYLLKQSTDYFSQSTDFNAFTHTWSLGVEEQFYIIFPFLIWFSGFGRQTINGSRNLFLIVGILSIASLIGFQYLYSTNQPAAYFLMPSRFWEMAAGCLIFIGFQKRASIEKFLERVPPLLILALIIVVMYLPMSMASSATISVVVLSSILVASLKNQTAAFKIFTHPKIVYIGLISYSLYLWHWGVLSISRWTIGIHWWTVPFQVGLMIVLALASHSWIETPLRKGDWFGKRWATLLSGGSFLAFLSGLMLLLIFPLSGRLYSGNRSAFASSIFGYGQSCNIFSTITSYSNLSNCVTEGLPDAPTLFVVGDSHAYQYKDPIAYETTKSGFGYSVVWGNSCLFPAAILNLGGLVCYENQKNVEQWLLSTVKRGDIVIVANALSGHFLKPTGYHLPNKQLITRDLALRRYAAVFIDFSNKILQKGARVVFYTDGLRFPGIIQGHLCAMEWFRPHPDTIYCYQSKHLHISRVNSDFPWLSYWADNNSKILWHASKLQSNCNENICGAFAYSDANHYDHRETSLIFKKFIHSSDLFQY
ncbi:acyltransferase [Cyanobium sp. ATX 6E8]|uniref:acyltransferase family protein n=1 Tax=Cyanobium sp. ATX 6E8 TaxID=2823701 RepID=UPI0020CD927F|nr:acyltransferase family protein [Cyanobium sp. ATX 6E8]MCP9941480.1 acyltransferase [Cyanobium sp. ATX 6E8]